MLRPRIIPCLLVQNGGLVKTVNFASPKYVGDPINAVRILNEKEVDELIVIDIAATAKGREPDYAMIRNLAAECRMPLCYGGGVKTLEQVVKIIRLGVEKTAISSVAVEHPEVIPLMADYVGSQSVVAVIDIKKSSKTGAYEVWTHNGSRNTQCDPVEFAQHLESLGVGEITLNSIDQDGVMKGYDLEIAQRVRNAVTVPMTVLGGAGKMSDIAELIRRLGVVGAAAGSLFVFKGIYRAVLISYPNYDQKSIVYSAAREDQEA